MNICPKHADTCHYAEEELQPCNRLVCEYDERYQCDTRKRREECHDYDTALAFKCGFAEESVSNAGTYSANERNYKRKYRVTGDAEIAEKE